ncbi:Sister chromatid cohesion protein PDS5 [Glycine max]|nr:Sister chromatid cohesion protein PDS5 [Glycine max]
MASANDLTETERSTAKSLRHVGRKLLKCSSVHKLLQLLDKLELLLSSLDQEPTKPIQESLVPAMKALISDELLRHTDGDVKISVTSCINEITRITAPDVPYDDEQMKEIFKLTVASFEKLSHISGRGYEKALTILDNANKVRLCLVMLDLECNDLVIEMFQHFLRYIRSDHPCNAIHSMEPIMTLILQEIEQISPALLRPLLDSVGNENQIISPMSWSLGEKVISNCAVNLKPYLMKAVESSGRALNEYAQILTDICQNQSESPQCDDSNGSKKTVVQEAENKLNVPKDAEEQPVDETKGHELDITGERDVQILDDTKSNIRSGTSAMDGESINISGSKRRPHSAITKNSKRGSAKANLETDNLESVQEPKSEMQLNTVPRKRGRKPNSLLNAEEGYDHSWIYQERKPGKSALSRKACNCSSPYPSSEKPTSRKDKLHRKPKTVSETLVSMLKSENIAKPAQSRRTQNIGSDFPANDTSEPKHKTDENTDAAPVNNNIPDGRHIKCGQPRKINNTGNQDVHSNSLSILKEDNLNSLLEKTSLDSPAVRLEKESEVRKDSEIKPIRKIKFSVRVDGKLVAPESVAKREPSASCGYEGKHKSFVNIELENIEESRSSAQTDVKKRRRLNATPNKGVNKSSAVKELIVESASKTLGGVKETPQASLRRRHITANVEASESCDDGSSLVCRRIKVWWPKDKMFYEGVIDSYDPIKGKHKILYADGDVEVLNLKRQRWEPVTVDVLLHEEGLAHQRHAQASDIAENGKEKSALESAKGANINSQSRGRASASAGIFKSVKSADTSAVDLADDSPIIFSRKDSRTPKTKRRRV